MDHTYARVVLPGDTATRRAGASARARAKELRPTLFQRLSAKLRGSRTDDYAWARGAEGEEAVGRLLDRLPRPSWRVVHDLQIGDRGANVDHLVIGPPGIFCIDTKNLRGSVKVTPRGFRVNGYRTPILPKVAREAARVERCLADALDGVRVVPVLVVLADEVVVKEQPKDVAVVTPKGLLTWLQGLTDTRLSPDALNVLERAIRLPTTWTDPAARPVQSYSFTPWRKYGHDRIYIKDHAGTDVAMYDRKKDLLEVTDETVRSEVNEALKTFLR